LDFKHLPVLGMSAGGVGMVRRAALVLVLILLAVVDWFVMDYYKPVIKYEMKRKEGIK
jgi:hypothetical protein